MQVYFNVCGTWKQHKENDETTRNPLLLDAQPCHTHVALVLITPYVPLGLYLDS